jgi:hypothetical protein
MTYFQLTAKPLSFLAMFGRYYDWIVFLSIEHHFAMQLVEQFLTGKPLFLKLINLSLVFFHQKRSQLHLTMEDVLAQCQQLQRIGKSTNKLVLDKDISMDDILALCIRDNCYEDIISINNEAHGSVLREPPKKWPDNEGDPSRSLYYNNPCHSQTSLWLLFSVISVSLIYISVAIVGSAFFMITEISASV